MTGRRRVVATGMGVVAPNGIGVEQFWDSLIHGRSGIAKITRFDASSYPAQIAGQIESFDPMDYMEPRVARRLDRFAHYALASASMAIQDARLPIPYPNPYRIGVYVGSAIGGGESIENQHLVFMEKGLRRVSPFADKAISTHSASGVISASFQLKGPNTTVSSGCNSGLDACISACNTIQAGDAEVIVVCGSEAPITPFTLAIFSAVGVLSRQNGDPRTALKPYDVNADGTVLAEGSGTVILEERGHALDRGATIHGEILGYASTSEAIFFEIGPTVDPLANALVQALEKAHLKPSEIDYINSHGNGILPYDVGETEAVKKAFGEFAYGIPLSSIKPLTGQSMSATGLFQLITSLLAIKEGIIPPTANLRNPAPQCDLNYVPYKAIQRNVNTVLMNAHGFGGRHTVLIVGNSR